MRAVSNIYIHMYIYQPSGGKKGFGKDMINSIRIDYSPIFAVYHCLFIITVHHLLCINATYCC
jgi:hypothetical protein